MRKQIGTALVLALSFGAAFAAVAQEKKPAIQPGPGVKVEDVKMPEGQRGVAQLVTVTATVEAIDQATRAVTLKAPSGKPISFTAGPEVKNLAQVKVGDSVVVKYYESLVFELQKPGAAKGVADAEKTTAQAKPGEKPSGKEQVKVRVTATISAIDKTTSYITLVGPKGNAYDVKARDPKVFNEIKVGDKVDVTYTEALAISVEPAPKK